MPPRSKVDALPDELRADLDQRLINGSFSGYVGLETWLRDLGFGIGKSAIHRYGSKLEERVAQIKLATEQARAIVTASPDDEGAVSDALMRLVQEKLFTLLMNADIDPNDKLRWDKLSRAVADLARASINQKKWATEVREKASRAADAVAAIAKTGGLSEKSVNEIRSRILGIAG